MTRSECEKTIERLMLDGPHDRAGIAGHLEGCESCRREADLLAPMFGAMAASAEVEPSAAIDRRIRAGLRSAGEPRPILRPVTAVGLGLAGLVALVGALGSAVAGAGAAEQGPLIVLLAISIYMTLSTTATLPLLLIRRRHEVRP